MDTNLRTVTAVIPTYNRAQLVQEALESVFAQTRPVDEIIVVDDGSTDNTPEVLKSYGDKIRYLRQVNQGAGPARNLGIREASGYFIALLDSDDLWLPDKTKIQVEFLSHNPQIDFLFSDMATLSQTPDFLYPEIQNQGIHDYLVAHSTNLEILFDYLIIYNFVPTSTVIFKRTCVDKIGYFNPIRIVEDIDYWLRASHLCRWGFVNAVLEKRRRHSGNLVNNWVEMQIGVAEVLRRTTQRMSDLSNDSKNRIAGRLKEIHYDLGSYYFKKRDFIKAAQYLRIGMPDKLVNGKWLFKLILSYLLMHLAGRSSPRVPPKVLQRNS